MNQLLVYTAPALMPPSAQDSMEAVHNDESPLTEFEQMAPETHKHSNIEISPELSKLDSAGTSESESEIHLQDTLESQTEQMHLQHVISSYYQP